MAEPQLQNYATPAYPYPPGVGDEQRNARTPPPDNIETDEVAGTDLVSDDPMPE